MSVFDDPMGPVVAATLEWCNTIRATKGLLALDELPKGDRHDPESCPCGAATGYHIDTDEYATDRVAWGDVAMRYPLPDPVIEFINEFDAGHLPQYDLHPDEEAFSDEA